MVDEGLVEGVADAEVAPAYTIVGTFDPAAVYCAADCAAEVEVGTGVAAVAGDVLVAPGVVGAAADDDDEGVELAEDEGPLLGAAVEDGDAPVVAEGVPPLLLELV